MALPPRLSIQDGPPKALVLYDLRDPEAWARAGRERAAWGHERATIHALDNDHVVIEFRAGGAKRIAR
jgi:hypothetical protein